MTQEVIHCSTCELWDTFIIELKKLFNIQPIHKKKSHQTKKYKKKHQQVVDAIYKKYIFNRPCNICKKPIQSKNDVFIFNSCNHMVHKKCIDHNQYYYIFDNKYINKYFHNSPKIYLKCPLCNKSNHFLTH